MTSLHFDVQKCCKEQQTALGFPEPPGAPPDVSHFKEWHGEPAGGFYQLEIRREEGEAR